MESKMRQRADQALSQLSAGGNMEKVTAAISSISAHHKLATRSDKKTPKELRKDDKSWRKWSKKYKQSKSHDAAGTPGWIKSVADSDCSKMLTQVQKEVGFIAEIFVMDQVGATACYSNPTSDYDQGDEDKWQVPFVQGKDVHQGDLEKDSSTGMAAIQFSFPLKQGGKTIGVVTIGATNKAVAH